MKRWLLAVGLGLLLLVAGLSGCSFGSGVTSGGQSGSGASLYGQQEGIWVTGEGKVLVSPDIAILRLGVSTQSESVAVAQSQAAEAMERVKTALTGNDVADKDIQTQQFSIQQVTRWDQDKGEEVVIGYSVTNMVTAKIREIDKTGSTIDAVVEAGGDLIRIDSIYFSVDEPSDYYDEARQSAVVDAKSKAAQIAKLAKVTLGKPTYISENIYTPSPVYPVRVQGEAAIAADTTSISTGELEISVTVQIVYAIR